MLFHLLNFLREGLGAKIPAAFLYTSSRMMLAAVTTLLLSVFLGPWFIRKLYALKIGQSIRKEECPVLAELHKNKENTPTMGGILILSSMLIAMFLWMDLTHVFTFLLLITTLTLGFLGGWDDYLKMKYRNAKGVSGRKKILVQVLLSLGIAFYLLTPGLHQSISKGRLFHPPIVKEQKTLSLSVDPMIEGQTEEATVVQMPLTVKDYATRLYAPFFKDPILRFKGVFAIFAVFLVVLVVTGSSNAVNLTDGLDGLASGCLLLVATSLAIIAFLTNNIDIAGYLNILYIEGSGEIAIYLSAFVGACLGFLWYNGYPAQVFMGDTGSLALGGIIGVSAVLLKRELLLAVVGGIFVAEALSVILQVGSYKFRNKKRILLCAPLHHHFEYKGLPETKVVLRFWIIGLLLAILGIASLKFQ